MITREAYEGNDKARSGIGEQNWTAASVTSQSSQGRVRI